MSWFYKKNQEIDGAKVGLGLFVVFVVVLIVFKILNDVLGKLKNEEGGDGVGGGESGNNNTLSCDPGYTREGGSLGKLCTHKCYTHPSLNDLFVRPKSDVPVNKFTTYDDFGKEYANTYDELKKWGLADSGSGKDYCYQCPTGYKKGKFDSVANKMMCQSGCPNEMEENELHGICYKGNLACYPTDSASQCAERPCGDGYTKQLNSKNQFVCVKDDMSCPEGMDEDSLFLGCRQKTIDATIATTKDPYFLY
jgi:hypothetical protein